MDDTTTEWAARASRARRRWAAAVLVAASALMLAGCGGSDDGGEADDTPVVTDTVTDTGTPTGTEAGGADGSEAGAKVFASAGCGGCHTLAEAGSSGAVGPNLDGSQPSHELVVERVTNGKGVMPSFADRLSSEQIQDVATYVSEAT